MNNVELVTDKTIAIIHKYYGIGIDIKEDTNRILNNELKELNIDK